MNVRRVPVVLLAVAATALVGVVAPADASPAPTPTPAKPAPASTTAAVPLTGVAAHVTGRDRVAVTWTAPTGDDASRAVTLCRVDGRRSTPLRASDCAATVPATAGDARAEDATARPGHTYTYAVVGATTVGTPVTVVVPRVVTRTGTAPAASTGTGSVRGTVTTTSGAPVSGAQALLFAYAPEGTVTLGSAITGANGGYRITGVPTPTGGTAHLCIDAHDVSDAPAGGFVDACLGADAVWDGRVDDVPYSALDLAVGDGIDLARIDLALATGATVSGTVTANGTGVAGATVYAIGASDTASFRTVTDAQGGYALAGVPTGTVSVCVDARAVAAKAGRPGYAPGCQGGAAWDGATVPAAAPPLVLAAGATPTVDVALRVGAAIGGRVTDADGAPLAGVTVSAVPATDEPAYPVDGSATQLGVPASAVTGVDGRYVVTGLLAGRYVTCFDADGARGNAPAGYRSQCSGGADDAGGPSVSAPRTTAVTGSIVTSDIALPAAGGITGRITDSRGRGIARVEVRAYGTGPVASTTTAADGTFTVAGLTPGSFVVCLEASAAGSGTVRGFSDTCSGNTAWDGVSGPPAAATPVTVTAGALVDATTTLAAGGAVSGTVTAGGAARAGAQVTVWQRDGSQLDQRAVTAADGTYTVRGLGAGSYVVCVDPDPFYGTFTGFSPACTTNVAWSGDTVPPASAADVLVRTGATTAGIDFALARGAAVTGRVTAPDGTPLRGVAVSAQGSSYAFSSTGSNGRYTLAGLAPGPVTVCFDATLAAGPAATGYASECHDDVAWQPGTSPPADADTVSVTAGRTVNGIDAELSPAGGVAGVVHPAGSATGLAGVTVWALDSTGLRVESATSAADGSFRIAGLATGRYRVCAETSRGGGDGGTARTCAASVAWDGGYPPSSAAGFDVTSGDVTAGADIGLLAGGAVTGVVRADGSGNRVPRVAGATVSVFGPNGFPVGRDVTAADGSYLVAGLPAGSYRVCVAPGSVTPGVLAAGFAPECLRDQPWDGVAYAGPASGASATTVTAGAATRVDLALAAGAALRGVATQAGSGTPVGRPRVVLFDPSGRTKGTVFGGNDGGWLVTDLLPGRYVVCVDGLYARSAAPTGVLGRCSGDVAWDGYGLPPGATPVEAVAAEVHDVPLALPVAGGLRGTVRGPGGIPVSAIVYASGAGGRTTTTTSNDGSYRLTGLPAGRYQVCAQAFVFTGSTDPGLRPTCSTSTPWNGSFPLPSAAPGYQVSLGSFAGPADVDMPRAGAVTGTVTDAVSGAPLPSVPVSVTSGGTVTGGYVFTDAAGRFTAVGLVTGSYTACTVSTGLTTPASPAGFLSRCWRDVAWSGGGNVPSDATAIPVTTGQITRGIAIRLPRAAGLTGRVTTDGTGAGVSGASVRVYRGSVVVPTAVGSPLTADDGSYTVGGLPAGDYTVCVDASLAAGSPSGWFSECHDDVAWSPTAPPPAGTTPAAVAAGALTTVDFAITPAAGIAGVATDVDGHPLQFVSVYVYRAADGQFVGNGYTRDDGRYAVGGLPAGRYVVCGDAASAGGGSSTTGYLRECHDGVAWGGPPAGMPSGATPVVARAGKTTALDLAFPPAAAVTALVTDASGNPLQNVEVSVFDSDGLIQVDSFTDNGRFEVRGLPAGSYRLCFDTTQASGGTSHSGYRRECYDNVGWNGGSGSPPAPDATPVPLTAGVMTTVRVALVAG